MAVRITAADLRETVNDILAEYGDEARAAVAKASQDVGKNVAKELKKAGTFEGGERFKKGWTATTEENRLGVKTVVYNKTQPGLAHLLEFGHAKAGGGRTTSFNFIAPIADTVEKRFTEAIEKNMEG